jgi:FkbM family methyltransferase
MDIPLSDSEKLWRCVKERRLPVRLKRFVPDLLGKISGQAVVYCRGGYRKFLKFKLDDKGMADLILDEIFHSQVYFPTITSRTKFEIKRGETVIDIGANIGLFATCAASLSRTGKVYCFEPSKDNFARLQYHRQHNGLDNIVPINKGVSDKAETLKLYLVDDNCGAYSTVDQSVGLNTDQENYEQIECVPLQQVFDEHSIARCHFLKIDCEGAELKILSALPAEYFTRIDRIALEYHPNVSALELAELLHKNGFSVLINGYPRTWGLIFAVRQ